MGKCRRRKILVYAKRKDIEDIYTNVRTIGHSHVLHPKMERL